MKTNPLKSKILSFLCAAFLIAAFTSGCGKSADAGTEKAANAAAHTWLTGIDNGDYDQSWQDSADLFQNAITQVKWNEALKKVRQPLGNLLSRQLASSQLMTKLPGVPSGHYVVMQFNTSFANLQPAVETVTFMLETDGTWKAAGYYIK